MARLQGWVRAWAAVSYLLGALSTAVVTVLALPLLCLGRTDGAEASVRQAWAGWHRQRAGRLRDVQVTPHRVPLPGFLRWAAVHTALGLPFGLVAVLCVGNLLLAVVVVPLWWAFPVDDPPRLLADVPVTDWGTALLLGPVQIAVLAALGYRLLPLLARVHATAGLAVLAPSAAEQLAERVGVLTRTRVDVLNAHGAELRRIERDLHDGPQARLVAVAMRLAVAREALPDDPQRAAELLRDAHEGTEEAMTELRGVVRTVYPPILSDRGLAGALTTVATRAGVPAQVDIGDLGRIPAAVEAVVYHAVTELLTNVAKHSRATRAAVRVDRADDRLVVTVGDDGIGGADDASGTGLAGIHRRVRALDGTTRITSPAGGPTAVTVEVPCGW